MACVLLPCYYQGMTTLTTRTLTRNSVLAFVLAGLAATTIHELFHLIMTLALGEKAVLFPDHVQIDDAVGTSHALLIAAVGPLGSLGSGLLLIRLTRDWGQGFARLFWLWFGFLSAQIGFGYLLVSALVQTGDTGLVLSLLNAPWYVYVLVTAIGGVGSWYLLPRLFSDRVSVFARDKNSFFHIGMYPWLIGTGILLVIYVIIGQIMTPGKLELFGLMAVVTIGIFTPIADFDAARATAHPDSLQLSMPVAGMVVTGVAAAIVLFVLTHGISF